MIAMSKSSKNIFWYGLGMLVLAYVLTRMADMILLVAASALVGLFPIRHPRWWKYGLLALVSLVLTVFINGISWHTVRVVGEITKLSGPGYVAAVVLVDLITVVLVSTTVQWWTGRWLLARWYGYKPRR